MVAWFSAILLAAGSVLFLGGGRQHPGVHDHGAGPEAFFIAFSQTIVATRNWHAMHMMILLGPLFWALGAPLLLQCLRPELNKLTSAARSALVISATLWAVAFVLDGYAAPVYAESLMNGVTADRSIMAAFAANAIMMSRLGLISWICGGIGIVLLSAALLETRPHRPWYLFAGVSGIALGIWPLGAALEGEYAGGPFTSRFWMWNALAVGIWYLVLGTCAFGLKDRIPATTPGGSPLHP